MKALLKKDIFTLIKQLRILLLFIAVFSCIPGFSASSFAIVYAAMLPVSAMAYDERAKWDALAVMMPYSPMDIVASKYVLGYLGVGIVGGLATSAQLAVSFVRGAAIEPEFALATLLTFCLGLIMLAVMLPLLFRFGVEKGRLAFFVVIIAVTVGGMALGDNLSASLAQATELWPVALAALGVAALGNALSIILSARLYRKRAQT